MDPLEQEVRELVERLLSDDKEIVLATLSNLPQWASPYIYDQPSKQRRVALKEALLKILEEGSNRSQRILSCIIRKEEITQGFASSTVGGFSLCRERRVPWKFRLHYGMYASEGYHFWELIGCREHSVMVGGYQGESAVPAFMQEADPEAALLEAVLAVNPCFHPKLAATIFVWTFLYPERWPWPATIEKIRHHLLKGASTWFGSKETAPAYWLWYAGLINERVGRDRIKYQSGTLKRPPEKQPGMPLALRTLSSLFSYTLKNERQVEWVVALMNHRGPEWAAKEWGELDWMLRERLRSVAMPYLNEDGVARARETVRSALSSPGRMVERADQEPQFIANHLKGIKTILEFGQNVSSEERAGLLALRDQFLQIQEQKEREERRRKAEAEAEEARRKARRELHEEWQARIAGRCSHIVTVFNGVFGLTIDPDSVLSGQVTGEYASINNAGPSLGMSMTLSLRLVQELHCRTETRLKIEEGDDLAEWRRAYTAGNCLVWHELAHLMDTGLIRTILKKHLPGDATPEAVLQARELALDAVAFRLATEIYVHPGGTVRHCTQAGERRDVMLQSIEAQVDRLRRWIESEPESIGRSCLITRFLVQMEAHELTKNRRRLAGLIEGQDKLRKLYAAIYADALMIGVLSQAFHSTVQTDDAEESEFFTGMAKSA